MQQQQQKASLKRNNNSSNSNKKKKPKASSSKQQEELVNNAMMPSSSTSRGDDDQSLLLFNGTSKLQQNNVRSNTVQPSSIIAPPTINTMISSSTDRTTTSTTLPTINILGGYNHGKVIELLIEHRVFEPYSDLTCIKKEKCDGDLYPDNALNGTHLRNTIETYIRCFKIKSEFDAFEVMVNELMNNGKITNKDVAASVAIWLIRQYFKPSMGGSGEITVDELVEFICSHINGSLPMLTNEGIQRSCSVLVSSFGTDFEFIGRNEPMEAIESIYANQKSLIDEKLINPHLISKSDVVLPFISAARGVGKSRFLNEMGLKLFENKDTFNCFPIFVTFGNGCQYNSEEVEYLQPIQSLFMRMIYSVVCSFSQQLVDYEDFKDSFTQFVTRRRIDMRTVLSAFKKVIGDESIDFYIALDDVHHLHSADESNSTFFAFNYHLNPLREVIVGIGEYMQHLPYYRTNLFPLFAGTYHNIININLAWSPYMPNYISLPALLPEDEIYLILDNLQLSHEKLNNWRTNTELRHFLRMFGGFAGGIEIYLYEYLDTKYNHSEESAFESAVSTLTDRYPVNGLYSKKLVYYILTRTVIQKSDVIVTDSVSGKYITISNLEHKGYIMLNQTKEKENQFIATYPPVLLRNLIPKELITIYDELFFRSPSKNVHGKSWEEIVHHYLYFNLTLISNNEEDLTIGQLFPFAKMQPNTASIPLDRIPKVRRVYAINEIKNNQHNKVSLLTDSAENFDFDVESNNIVKFNQKKCCVTMNVSNAEAGDVLIMGLQLKHSSTLLIIHIQCKWADSGSTLSLLEIQEELNKNRQLQFRNEHNEILATYNLTVIITGKSIPNIPNDEDLIVIHKDNFNDYFGVFANQMKFLNTKQFLHVNECTYSELQKLEGIDRLQALKIIIRRGTIGFVDNDDLKRKVGSTLFNLLSKFEIIY